MSKFKQGVRYLSDAGFDQDYLYFEIIAMFMEGFDLVDAEVEFITGNEPLNSMELMPEIVDSGYADTITLENANDEIDQRVHLDYCAREYLREFFQVNKERAQWDMFILWLDNIGYLTEDVVEDLRPIVESMINETDYEYVYYDELEDLMMSL